MRKFETLNLALQFSQNVRQLRIDGEVRRQLLLAATSIPLKLAEGNAKYSAMEKRRLYQIAYALLKECQVIIRTMSIRDAKVVSTANHLKASLDRLIE